MKKYLSLLVMSFVAPLHAASVLENHISYCQTLTSDEQRLVCYDRIKLTTVFSIDGNTNPEAPKVKAPVQPAAPVITATPEVVALTTTQAQSAADFGIEHKKEEPQEQQDKLTLTLTKLGKTPHGELIFTFENGQVWRQVSKETFIASEGQRYTLQRGALNSFFVSKEGQARQTRVRREK